ncbi:histidine kinase [Frateuria sp. Soil773]|uniref:response regulator n=1 Tax=Frateuria sp. Soil773 TaxID=1736407 RepID=UPI0007010799|nr:response regulator [Frateuria sp. Soil773]KRE89502.1 histidine kinase [Frateuria sp. Soil773]
MAGIGFFKRLLGNAQGMDDPEAGLLQAQAATPMLVVDDSPTIRTVLGRILAQDGYAVQAAENGEDALELIRAAPPALVFLDIVLPGINGFAVLRALRHDPRTRHVPIVMISGNPQATEQFYAQRFGADDFIRKPFARADICASIDTLVRAQRLPARAALPAQQVVAEPPNGLLA